MTKEKNIKFVVKENGEKRSNSGLISMEKDLLNLRLGMMTTQCNVN